MSSTPILLFRFDDELNTTHFALLLFVYLIVHLTVPEQQSQALTTPAAASSLTRDAAATTTTTTTTTTNTNTNTNTVGTIAGTCDHMATATDTSDAAEAAKATSRYRLFLRRS